MKKLTIHGDGWDAVFVDEDGNKIEGVYSAVIRLQAGEPTTVELEINMPLSQVTAHVNDIEFRCPLCSDILSHKCEPDTLSGR